MSLTQNDIDGMSFEERCLRAAARLGWNEESIAWDADIPSQIIRWILFPFLEPRINTSPRTVFCQDSESTSTVLVSEALGNAGLNEVANESEQDALGRCLAAWSGL